MTANLDVESCLTFMRSLPTVSQRLPTRQDSIGQQSISFTDTDGLHAIGPESSARTSSANSKSAYKGLIFAPSNRTRIFLATMYLRDNLRDKAKLDESKFKFNLSKESKSIIDLAADMVVAIPALTGATGGALCSLIEKLIKVSREFEAVNDRTTGGGRDSHNSTIGYGGGSGRH
ncbi:hypothetical protein BGZ97_000862 [Linnemannia gamsii]|uniref:Uncharacterized protein n=1 Tax=Linnemannia gamsii TaxID=64522 RepID=A0A9P6QZL4_9FUNG|nr:hypothetical protein BGZ97_000862 [Linnemannia gamsii]